MMKKKMVALLLSLAMLLSLVPVTAVAEGANISMALTYPDGRTAETLQKGDTVTLTVSNNAMTVSSFTFNVSFDKEKFECVSIAGSMDGYPDIVYIKSTAPVLPEKLVSTKSNISEANDTGSVGFGWSATENATYVAGKIVTITFEAKDFGSADFILNEDSAGQNAYKNTVSTTPVTVVKTPIAAASATIDAPTKGQEFPSTVTIPENAGYSASVAWFTDEDCTNAAEGTVRGGQTYYAKITLTPDTANGESFADSVAVTGSVEKTEAPNADGNLVLTAQFTTPERKITDLAATTATQSYEVGNTFDAATLVMKATYDDGTTDEDYKAYTVTVDSPLTADTTSATITSTENADVSYSLSLTVSKLTLPNDAISYTNGSADYEAGKDHTDAAKAAVSFKDGLTEALMGKLSIIFMKGDEIATRLEDAGLYEVYVSTDGTGTKYNAKDKTKIGTYEINKVTASVTTAPSTRTDLTYKGQAQELVVGGTASGGTMQYSLDGVTYSDKIPTGTNAGEYTVSYKVVGDANHIDTEPVTVNVTIARKAVTVKAENASKTYGQSDPALSATVTGLVGQDTVAYTLSRTAGEDVNTYDITATGETVQGNYTVTYAKGTFTINKAAASVTAAPAAVANLTYSGSAQALLTAGTASGGTMQYSLDGTNYSKTIPTGKNAGNYTVYYKVAGDANHSDTEPVDVPVTIDPKAVTVTADNKTKTYGDSDPALTATVSGVAGGDTIVATASRVAGNDVGDYTITAAIDADNSSYTAGNYDVTFVSGTLTITQAENSISGLTMEGWTYGENANTPTATATFDTPTFTYSNAENGNFTPDVPTNAGTWYVKAAVAETTNYKGAEDVKPFTIAQREVTLTWGERSFTYDGQPHAPTATAGNLKDGDTVNVTVTGEQTNAGSNYTATASISNSNYKLPEVATCAFTIAKADIAQAQLSGSMTVRSKTAKPVTFTLPTLPKGASYDTPTVYANDDGLIGTAAPAVSDTTLSFSVTSRDAEKTATITVPVNGGNNYNNATYTLTVTSQDKDDAGVTVAAGSSTVIYGDSLTVTGSANDQAGSGTWTWISSNSAVVTVSGNGASPIVTVKGVGQATITGTFENDDYLGSNTATVTVTQREVTLTWGTATFNYDGKFHVPTVTLGNVKTGDTVNVTVTGEQTNAGTNYTATAESLDNGNYKLPAANTHSFTINKVASAVTTAPTAQNLTYTGTAQALVSEGEATGGAMQYSLDGTNYSTTIPTGTAAGSYTVYYKVVGDENHNDTARASVKVTIAKADAGYTAPTAQKLTYNGQAQPLVTAGSTVDGTMQYRLGYGTWGTTVPTATKAGTYTVYYRVTGDKNHNDVAAASVYVTIARKAVTVTADDADKVYGAADPGRFTATVSGTVGNDKVTYTLRRAAGENAGTYDITASGNAIQSNYDVTFVNGTFTITKAANAVTDLAITGWTYGDQANAPSAKATFGAVAYTYSNAENGDFTATVPVNAGTWYVKAAVAGTDNYDGAQAVKSFTIAPKAVTIAANNATKVYGESDPTLTVTVTGVVSGDTIVATASRADGNNNVGSYTISAAVDTNSSQYTVGNYNIKLVNATLTITPKTVTVKANDAEKTYGQDDPTLFATVTGLVGDDVITYDVTRQQGENAGRYTITASGAANQGNYTVTYVAGKFTVKPLTGEEVVAGEGVSQMEDSQIQEFREALALTDEAVGIQEGDSEKTKQEKRENAVKDAMVSTAKLSNAGTSGLYFVNANSAAVPQIVLAVPNGTANSGRFNYKVIYMAANGAVTEVPSQVTVNGIVADLTDLPEDASGVYMVAYTPKPVHVVDDSASASGSQSIITDLTGINRVTVDGKTVDSKYYTVSGGVVTLSEAYLRTLSNGKHTVRVENAKYVSTAVITVSNSTVKSAGTGDAGLGLYAMLALSSVTGAAWLGLKKRKED